MSTGLAKTSFTSSFRIFSSSSAQLRMNGSAVATVSVAAVHVDRQDPVALGVRVRHRLRHRREVDLQRIDVQIRHAELAGQPLDEPVERERRVRRGRRLPLLTGDEFERVIAARRREARELVGVARPQRARRRPSASGCPRGAAADPAHGAPDADGGRRRGGRSRSSPSSVLYTSDRKRPNCVRARSNRTRDSLRLRTQRPASTCDCMRRVASRRRSAVRSPRFAPVTYRALAARFRLAPLAPCSPSPCATACAASPEPRRGRTGREAARRRPLRR